MCQRGLHAFEPLAVLEKEAAYAIAESETTCVTVDETASFLAWRQVVNDTATWAVAEFIVVVGCFGFQMDRRSDHALAVLIARLAIVLRTIAVGAGCLEAESTSEDAAVSLAVEVLKWILRSLGGPTAIHAPTPCGVLPLEAVAAFLVSAVCGHDLSTMFSSEDCPTG